MNASYRNIKNEMNLYLLQLEEILNDEQLTEGVTFNKTGYKEAGNKALASTRRPQKKAPTNRKVKAGTILPRSNLQQQTVITGAGGTNQ
jgi:hypothetical protein